MVLDVLVGMAAPGRIAHGTIPLMTVWLMLKEQNGSGTSNLDVTKHLSKHQVKSSIKFIQYGLSMHTVRNLCVKPIDFNMTSRK